MNTLRKITDLTLYFCFCFLAGTGIMMKFSFTKGLGPETVLGLGKRGWEACHLCVGLAMLCAVAVHLVLNRAWILKVGAGGKKRAAIAVIAFGLIMIVVLALSPAAVKVSL